MLEERATRRHTESWNAHLTLCHVALARGKSLPLQNGIRHGLNTLFALVDELMFYAHEVEYERGKPPTQVLDELDRVISKYAEQDMSYHWTNARDLPSGPYFEEGNYSSFLSLAIQARLRRYVSEKLDKQPSFLKQKKGRPLLDYALRPNIVTPTKLPHFVDFIDFDLVAMLLEKGADPNQKVVIYASTKTTGEWFKAAELMIRKGADRHLMLETVQKETVTNPDHGADETTTFAKTAKYRRTVKVKGGGGQTAEIETIVRLSALKIMEDVLGNAKMDEIKAIIPEKNDWK
ncbi:MAG: hypothetical protein Q9164_007641, partial [Protoblastenia rupestris]